MESRTRERVTDWQSRTLSGGIDGLRSLADQGFSGAVTAGTAWLFMLNGRITGIYEGSLDDFEGTEGTIYEAPDPSLPLLFTMLEEGGEERAQYYTEKTAVEEADRTLKSGGFTGYLELSENVLSGDYYVCYYGDRSLPAAFIGQSERLLTGDEAFDRANDEVGIFTVYDVEIDVVELPGDGADSGGGAGAEDAGGSPAGDASSPEGHGGPQGGAGGQQGGGHGQQGGAPGRQSGGTGQGDGAGANRGAAGGAGADRGAGGAAGAGERGQPEGSADAEPVQPPPEDGGSRADSGNGGSTADPQGTPESTRSGGRANGQPSGGDPGGTSGRSQRGSAGPPNRSQGAPDRQGAGGASESRREAGDAGEGSSDAAWSADLDEGGGPAATEGEAAEESPFQEEEQWRETKSIPSIDPDRTAGGGGEEGVVETANTASPESGRSRSTPAGGDSASGETPFDAEILEREDKIDRLQERVSNLEAQRERLQSERDQLQTDNERLRAQVDELEGTIGELEAEIESLRSEGAEATEPASRGGSGSTGASRSLSPEQALAGTNLFVRYDSKGDETLEKAHDGLASREDVTANLRLEHHTQFEGTDVSVDGRPFEEFLQGTIEYQFVSWVVHTLLFEIRDTGNGDALVELYDALPQIDRAEIHGTVTSEPDGDGEAEEEADGGLQETFDVVLRNRMGEPLVVANLNDSRDPATEEMMVSLQESAHAVKEAYDGLGAAFMVTTSFFKPGALETAEEATSGSFLSRDSRKSFVKLSRKKGYHLCLVETREGNFHMNVPEL